MTKLAETKNMKLADATALMEDLAHVECELAVITARKGKKLADLESEFKVKTDPLEEKSKALKAKLALFAETNQHLFQNPRTIKTPFGKFGLRTVNDIKVWDAEILIETLLELGYEDCVKTTRAVIKPALKARLDGGEAFPGVTVRASEEPEIKVADNLIKQAVKEG